MRVAVVHDWLVTYAGAEKVLEQILICFPQAEVYSTINFVKKNESLFLGGRPVQTTFIQRLPFSKRKYRSYLPLMPFAVEQLNLSCYDIIISSSHAVAKGVLVGPDQLHICYCHSPFRYAWDLQHQYLEDFEIKSGLKGGLIRWLLHRLRIWDVRTANGVDQFVANSYFIARRIEKAYRRKAVVIYPPVDTGQFELCKVKSDFYLAGSRMVPYKKIPMIVQAFTNMPDKKLVVFGDGPEFEKVKKIAGPNIQILGYQSPDILKNLMQHAKAYVFAAIEDFGIAPVEAQACGTPVIAFGKGGVLESIRGLKNSTPTGIIFEEQTVEAIQEAVNLFEQSSNLIVPEACRKNAERFSNEKFRKYFIEYVTSEYELLRQQKLMGT